jgi:hypothetical protein
MGCNQSTPIATPQTTTIAAETNMSSDIVEVDLKMSSDIVEVDLKKHRSGCTGMFWRKDPTGATSLKSNANWPRDGAKLRGRVVEAKGEKWLLATEVLQTGSSKWVPAPAGAAMPFEYDNHYSLE